MINFLKLWFNKLTRKYEVEDVAIAPESELPPHVAEVIKEEGKKKHATTMNSAKKRGRPKKN